MKRGPNVRRLIAECVGDYGADAPAFVDQAIAIVQSEPQTAFADDEAIAGELLSRLRERHAEAPQVLSGFLPSATIVVNGARCTWWGFLSEAATARSSGLPCCPHCGSVLFEQSTEAWWRAVDAFELARHTHYRAFIEWMHGKCFRTIELARSAYDAGRGNA